MKLPIHSAVKANDVSVVEALILQGADVAAPNSKGLTALDIAKHTNKEGSHDQVIEILQSISPNPIEDVSSGEPPALNSVRSESVMDIVPTELPPR